MPPAGRKGTFDRAQPVESAFALLSQKVTKAKRGNLAFDGLAQNIADKNIEDGKV